MFNKMGLSDRLMLVHEGYLLNFITREKGFVACFGGYAVWVISTKSNKMMRWRFSDAIGRTVDLAPQTIRGHS